MTGFVHMQVFICKTLSSHKPLNAACCFCVRLVPRSRSFNTSFA